jgi:hypothetical protein
MYLKQGVCDCHLNSPDSGLCPEVGSCEHDLYSLKRHGIYLLHEQLSASQGICFRTVVVLS